MAVSSVLQSIVGDLQRLGLVQPPGGSTTTSATNPLYRSLGGTTGGTMPPTQQEPIPTPGPTTAQQEPPGQNPFAPGGGGTTSDHPYTFTGPDGTTYIWDDNAGQYKPAPGIPPPNKGNIPVVGPNPYNTFQDWLGPPTQSQNLPPNDPRAQQAISDARARYLNGTASESDLNTLLAAPNGISPSDVRQYYKDYGAPGGGYDPSGLANVGARYAELAETTRAHHVQEALDAAAAADARMKATQQARLDAARYAVTPSMRASGYFPGFEPSGPLASAGLLNPISFQPQAFNPAAGAQMDPAQVQRDLAAIRGMG